MFQVYHITIINKITGKETEVEIVFYSDDCEVVVKMSKYVKITGLFCIGFPENLKWLNDMKKIPEYLIFFGERCF